MVTITSYTVPTSPENLYKPIDDNILAMGEREQYNRAEKASEKISSSYSNLFNIPAQGKDAEILNQYQEEAKQQISQLTKSGLDNPQTIQKINNLISQYTTNADIQAIAKRSFTHEAEAKKEQAAADKGETYRSPAKKSIEDYWNSGVYLKNPTNINFSTGWVMPDQGKIMKQAKELVEPTIEIITDAQGRRQEVKRYNPEDLKLAIEQVASSNPNYEKELNYQFQEQYADTDWDDYSKQENSTLVLEAVNNKEAATLLYQQTKDPKYLKIIANSNDVINTFSDVYENPDSPEQTKLRVYQDFKNKQIYQAISAMDAEQRKPVAMDELKKAQMDLSNDLYKMRETELFKLETDSGLSRKNYASEADFIKAAAIAVQKNKIKTAEASNPSLSTRSENYIDYIREGAIKDGTEKKAIESNISNNIDYFKNVGFTNIKGIESVKMDKNGDFIVDFNREKFNPINLPIGVINNNIGDEVKLTKDEMARIMEVGTGKRKVEDLNNIFSITSSTTQTPSNIGLTLGYFQFGNDTIQAYQGNSMADTANLKPGDKIVINGKLYEK